MQNPTNSRIKSPLPSNQQFLFTKYLPRSVQQNSQKDDQQTVHFWDWVTFEKGSQYILGHYQGVNGLGLQVIKKTKQSKKYLPFGFFVVVPLEESPKSSQLLYSSSFYLMHVETGLYLASLLNEVSKQTVFDHITLKVQKDESCVFKFKKEMKGNKNVQDIQGPSYDSYEHKTNESNHEYVSLNSSLRIFNTLTSKYIQLVKIDAPSHYTKKPTDPIKQPHPLSQDTFSKPEPYCSNIWLSYNFDYFTIRLQRRSREYNPLLLSNYDTVMMYNQFTNCYIGVRKKRGLMEIISVGNNSRLREEEGDSIRKTGMTGAEGSGGKQKSVEENKDNPLNSYKIQVNQYYLSAKNCLVEETSANAFQNKQTLSYLWKVFTRPYHKNIAFADRFQKTFSHPSLIKSKQVLYFQHVETGLFMLKNQDENENGETYILCEDLDEAQEDKDEAGRFMFRVQNLCVLRYDRQFIMTNHWPGQPLIPTANHQLTAHLQPINISLPVTIDFQQQQFLFSKLPIYPRINYFTFHFGSFLNVIISFLNNPKAIDDRIYLLKEKLIVMEMIYEKILCEGFVEIVGEIDKGYYFLDATVKILKVIRVKMRQYELEAVNIKNMRDNMNDTTGKKKTHGNIAGVEKTLSKKFTSNNQHFTYDQDHYSFHNMIHPFQELLELNNTIFTVLRPLIKKILNFLALVFGSQNADIFHLINQVTQAEMFNAYQAENMTRSAQKNFQDNSSGHNFDSKSIIIKKKNLTNSGINKKKSRNNSSSSFKSDASSTQNLMENSLKNQKSSKSPLSACYAWGGKESCTSQLLKELIKSLVHLLEVQPKASSQILKLVGTQEPYEIIGQVNQKLQKLEQRLNELNESGHGGSKYFGYEPASHVMIGTSLRLHKQFESGIHEEMYHFIKLINHIIEYFNDDLEYDWSKKLKHIQTYFQVKTNYGKESKEQHNRQGSKKESQLAIEYKKRWYKMSEVLNKTQKTNFKKIYRHVKQNRLKQADLTRKKSSKRNIKSHSKQKFKSKESFNVKQKSRGSLFGERQQENLLRRNSDDISSLSEGTIFNANFSSFRSSKKIKDNKKVMSGNEVSRTIKKEFVLVQQEKDYFFECLKQVMKLKVINLKSRSLPLMQIFPSKDSYRHNNSIKNYFSMYRQLPSLAFVLQIVNNIEISLLNNLSSSSESLGSVNISLLNNSRYICCDFNPISETTNLFKVLNFKPFISEQNIEFQDCPVFFKQDTVDYLITSSPFSFESLEIIFSFFNESKSDRAREQLELEILAESMQGLKVFLISLEIFVSVGKCSFLMFKKVEKYLLKICSLVVKYEENKFHSQSSKISTKTSYRQANLSPQNSSEPQQIPWSPAPCILPAQQITTGIKDTMQSMMIQLNEIIQILFIQKKRLINYPYITNSTQFFQAKYFKCQYGHLIKSSSSIAKDMPILTEMFELSNHLALSESVLSGTGSRAGKGDKHQYFPPYQERNLNTLTNAKMSCVLAAYKQNQALLTWPYLSPEEILIFYPKQLTLYKTTFTKTSSTIIQLNELNLLLKTLKSLEHQQKIKNNMIIEVKEKIASIAMNLRGLLKVQGNKKIIKSFGLIEMVLGIVLSNSILEKSAIKPFLQFLIQIRMWNVTLRQALRVLAKGGLLSQSPSLHKSAQLDHATSNAFLINNIKKQQFFVIMAKYLQEKSTEQQKLLVTELITSNLTQILDYTDSEHYQEFMQKLSFVCMLIEINPSQQTSRKLINKLLNRQDVQLYIQALKTLRNFQYFCHNIKNIKILLQSKRIIQQTIYNHNSSSENIPQNRNVKNSSIFNMSANINSNIKLRKTVNETGAQRQQMTNEKRQEINKFVLMMTTIFKICKADPQLVNQYMSLFLSFKEFLKILRANIASLGYSYEMLKPLLVYLQCNVSVFAQDKQPDNGRVGHMHGGVGGGIWHQNEILCYLQPLNDILAQYHLHIDQIQSYQSTSTFFLPFIEQDDTISQQQHLEFNKDKVKKITSQIKNFNKKNHFWELLLWTPSYQKQQGLLVIIEKIILKNLPLFASNTPFKTKRSHKSSSQSDSLEKLELPLNRVLHCIYDNLMNIDTFLDTCKSSRFSRLHTRIRKLKIIFIEIFPTIESSLSNLKSQKVKQIKEKQEMADSHVIEQEDEDSFGFFSDEKNPKSQLSYFDRLDSFQSMNRKEKNKRITRKIVMHEARSTQMQKTLIIKQKQRQDKQKAQMIGYQFVTKLFTNQKLDKFIKVFQQNENKRQAMIMEGLQRQRSFNDVQSIKLMEKSLTNNFEQYLDDQSEDCVVDMRESSKMGKSEKDKQKYQTSTNKIQGSQGKFELQQKKSKSQINELLSIGDASNYSHHAIIVAENSLQQDMVSNPNEVSSSKVSSDGNMAARHKKFLTKVAFQPTFSLKDFKRTDYSHFYEKLKSYKYYEVMALVKKVIFEQSSRFEVEFQCQQQNELYYELQRFLLDFYRCNGTVNQLFVHIQTYLKLQAQRLINTEFDYRPGCQIDNVRNKFSFTFKKSINDQASDFLNQVCEICCNRDLQLLAQKEFNPEILFVLYKREKYDIVDNLLKDYMAGITEKEPNLKKLIHAQGEINVILEFLVLCLEKDSGKEEAHMEMALMKEEGGNKIDKKKLREKNIFQSQKISFTSPNLSSGSRFHFSGQSSPSYLSSSSPFPTQPSYDQHIIESLQKKLFRLKIISKLIVIINYESTHQVESAKGFSQVDLVQLGDIQENLNCYVYELIESLLPMLSNRDLMKYMPTIDSVEVLGYQIKENLTKHLLQYVSFISLSPMSNPLAQILNPTKLAKRQPNISNMMSHMLSFCLGQSYEQLILSKDLLSQRKNPGSKSGKNKIYNKQAPQEQFLEIGSICLLKEFLNTMAEYFKENQNVGGSAFLHQTLVFSEQLVVGSLEYSMKLDLTSQNVQSLQIISLLSSSYRFLQIFLSSISSIKMYHNTQLREYFFRFYLPQKSQSSHNKWSQIDFKAQMLAKIIQFELYLYEILFKSKFGKFQSFSHTTYLKHMMQSYESQLNNSQNFTERNFEQQRAKPQRYAVLMHLLIDSLNFIHQIYFKINAFPHFQTNLYEQRKLIIQHDPILKIRAHEIQLVYTHLQSILGIVIVSPQRKQGKNQLQVATFPLLKQFQFVWKFSLIKLAQSFMDETIRKRLVYGATMVFMQQSNQSRNLKYYLTKLGQTIRTICQILTVLMIMSELFLPISIWHQIIINFLMVLNICFLTAIMVEKMFPTLIIAEISMYLTDFKVADSLIGIAIVYIPVVMAIGFNVCAFWEKKAILGVMVVFLFNRFESFYAFMQQHYRSIKTIFLYLMRTVVLLLTFHLIIELDIIESLNDANYLSSDVPLYVINGEPFNFLGMLFEKVKDSYMTNLLIIFYYVFNLLNYILIVSASVFYMMEGLKLQNINSETGKIRECYICSKKAQMLLQQQIQIRQRKQRQPKIMNRQRNHHIKQHYFTTNCGVQKLYEKSVNFIPEREREELMCKILESHIHQRHNIFSYISYFCYVLDKKNRYLTQKEKLIKARFESRDYEVYH